MGCHLTITIKVLDLSTLHWQPVGNLTSARLHLKLNLLGMFINFTLSFCRQGLVLVETGQGALAMGGIDQQYQVSKRLFCTNFTTTTKEACKALSSVLS